MRDKIYLYLTFIILPVYWIRAIILNRTHNQRKKEKEFLRYGNHYLGFRRNKVILEGDVYSNPAIYISNHQSMNDIFILITGLQKPFRFVAKKELFDSKITGPFMRMTGSYSLDRDDPRQSLKTLKTAVIDSKDHSILVFPEGTRSKRSEMLPLKEGLFSMLKRAEVPIVPVFIHNSYKKDQRNYRVSIGQPLMPSVFNELKTVELVEMCQEAFDDMRNRNL